MTASHVYWSHSLTVEAHRLLQLFLIVYIQLIKQKVDGRIVIPVSQPMKWRVLDLADADQPLGKILRILPDVVFLILFLVRKLTLDQ